MTNRKRSQRYFQLKEMMIHYNPDFDERKYWAYGCNCLILGKLHSSFLYNGLLWRFKATNDSFSSVLFRTIIF